MKILIDTEKRTMDYGELSLNRVPLYSKEAFEVMSQLWLKQGWELRYPYTFSWLGFPILQIPEDMIRMAEVIHQVKPDIIVETGVAHGGSMIYYASILEAMGHGDVIGIEKGLRCRREVQRHRLGRLVSLIEGDSTDPAIVKRVHELCAGQRVLVILDSDHSRAHVARELEAYHDLVCPGSYIVATDGNMGELADLPRAKPEWRWNNPQEAAIDFARRHPEFKIEQPAWPFNDSALTKNVTYWPGAWLKRTTRSSGAADNAVPSPAAQPDAVAAGSHQRNTQEKAA